MMDRTPPQSIDAEQSVLGGLMLKNEAIDDVLDVVDPDMFYKNSHQEIYRAIVTLIESNKKADAITVSEHLLDRGVKDEDCELLYLATLSKNTPGTSAIKNYAEIVSEKHKERKLAELALNVEDIVYGAEADKTERALDAISQILESTEKKGHSIYVPDRLSHLVDTISARFESGHGMLGITSGFPSYDGVISGLCPGDLIIVAGRPGMGKSTFAMNIAANVSEEHTVQVFSLEMPADQLIERQLASTAKIPLKVIRSGKLEDDHWPKMTNAMANTMQQVRLHIDDRSGIGINDIKAVCRRMKRKHDLRVAVIDYLQIMDMGKGDNETQQLGKITGQLKILAKNLGITIICLSQLNRSLENRPNKRPIMSDLRQSGKIEEDADIITFLYRDEVYNPETEYKGTAEVITRKARNGEPGTKFFQFEGWCTRFSEFDRYTNYGE